MIVDPTDSGPDPHGTRPGAEQPLRYEDLRARLPEPSAADTWILAPIIELAVLAPVLIAAVPAHASPVWPALPLVAVAMALIVARGAACDTRRLPAGRLRATLGPQIERRILGSRHRNAYLFVAIWAARGLRGGAIGGLLLALAILAQRSSPASRAGDWLLAAAALSALLAGAGVLLGLVAGTAAASVLWRVRRPRP